MQITCENCFTLYESSEKNSRPIGCPYCGHLNQANTTAKDQGPDQSKTMLNLLEGEMQEEGSAVRKLIVGKTPSLLPQQEMLVEVLEGEKKGQKFAVRKPKITVGRKGSDIQLSDPEVSRRHCVVAVFGDALILRDLGSSNGTMVNRSLVKEILLKEGDQIRMGDTVLTVSLRKIL
jgi:hypothetical protein